MSGFWRRLTENFNNRELAGAIWLTLVFLILLAKKDFRKGISGIIKALAAPQVMFLFPGFAGFIAILAWLGVSLDNWTNHADHSLVSHRRFASPVSGLLTPRKVRSISVATRHLLLSGTALLEFLYVAKTFSLPVELILAPVTTFVALLAAFSERDAEPSAVNSLMTWLLAFFAVVVFWNSIS